MTYEEWAHLPENSSKMESIHLLDEKEQEIEWERFYDAYLATLPYEEHQAELKLFMEQAAETTKELYKKKWS